MPVETLFELLQDGCSGGFKKKKKHCVFLIIFLSSCLSKYKTYFADLFYV